MDREDSKKPRKGVSKLSEGLFVCSLEALGCGAVFYVAVLEMLPDSLEGGWTVLKELFSFVRQ